jgi:hypothetical protein
VRTVNSLEDLNPLDLRNEDIFKHRVLDSAVFWKPVLHGLLTYTEARGMHPQELREACAALDMKGKDL